MKMKAKYIKHVEQRNKELFDMIVQHPYGAAALDMIRYRLTMRKMLRYYKINRLWSEFSTLAFSIIHARKMDRRCG